MNSRPTSLTVGQKHRLAITLLIISTLFIAGRWRSIGSEFLLNLSNIQLNYFFSDRPVQTTATASWIETSQSINPTNSNQPTLGYAFLAQGETSKAIEVWQDYPAIAIELTNRGSVATTTDSLNWYQLAIEVDATYAPAYHRLCNHYLDLGHPMLAAGLYNDAPKSVAGTASMKICVGIAHLSQNETTRAVSYISEAVEQEPQRASYWQWLSLALTRNGAIGDAINASLEATRLDASKPDYWEHLGNLYRESEQWDLARSAYEIVLEIEPNNNRTNQALADLPNFP